MQNNPSKARPPDTLRSHKELHWDQWFTKNGQNGYFQVSAAAPVAMVRDLVQKLQGGYPPYTHAYPRTKRNGTARVSKFFRIIRVHFVFCQCSG